MRLCLDYARPLSGDNEQEVFGLDVAITNMLSALSAYTCLDKLHITPADIASLDHIKDMVRATGRDADSFCIGLDPRTPSTNMGMMDVLFRADPQIVRHVWQRHQLPKGGYATCGIVHTMSGERPARTLNELLLSPSTVADALICPSRAIRDAVWKAWEIQADYYRHRSGGDLSCAIETPIIPLGIHTSRFQQMSTAEKRVQQRAALDLAEDEVMILFLGRLSFATKAHPIALWLAAAEAAKHAQKKLRVVMYGYFKPREMRDYYLSLAADYAQQIRIDFIENNDPRFPDSVWAAADIFVSLSDNVQESFGLTPIEAMACGLPVIAADWDGYRDTVRNRIDGLLIPTTIPAQSSGLDLAQGYYNNNNYGVYLASAAQSTIVDIERCAAAITVLADNPDLRARMGASGRQRAAEVFDWKVIIPAYEEVWAMLADRRAVAFNKPPVPAGWQAAHTAYPNPFAMFGGFATEVLGTEHQVQILLPDDDIRRLMAHDMNYFLPLFLQPKESMMLLIDSVRRAGSPSIGQILAAYPPALHNVIYRCIGWMGKHGVARCWKA